MWDRVGIFVTWHKVSLSSELTFMGLSFLVWETGRKRTLYPPRCVWGIHGRPLE